MALSTNTIAILNYLKTMKDQDVTAADVAAALGLDKKTVEGGFTAGIQRKGLGIRVPAEVELEDGSHKDVKFLKLTDAGLAFDPNAVVVDAE